MVFTLQIIFSYGPSEERFFERGLYLKRNNPYSGWPFWIFTDSMGHSCPLFVRYVYLFGPPEIKPSFLVGFGCISFSFLCSVLANWFFFLFSFSLLPWSYQFLSIIEFWISPWYLHLFFNLTLQVGRVQLTGMEMLTTFYKLKALWWHLS